MEDGLLNTCSLYVFASRCFGNKNNRYGNNKASIKAEVYAKLRKVVEDEGHDLSILKTFTYFCNKSRQNAM